MIILRKIILIAIKKACTYISKDGSMVIKNYAFLAFYWHNRSKYVIFAATLYLFDHLISSL